MNTILTILVLNLTSIVCVVCATVLTIHGYWPMAAAMLFVAFFGLHGVEGKDD